MNHRFVALIVLLGCSGCGPNDSVEDGLLGVSLNGNGPSSADETMHWYASWSTAMHPLDGPQRVVDQTLRQVVRLSTGGEQLRVRLSNRFGTRPLTVSRASLALAADEGAVVAESLRPVTFDGESETTIAPGETVTSDPVLYPVEALETVSVSLYFADVAELADAQSMGPRAGYVVAGDATGAPNLEAPSSAPGWSLLCGVDVSRTTSVPVIVAFGDSITQGFGSSEAEGSWPSRVATDLTGRSAIVNLGISGNRLLAGARPGLGLAGVERYDWDALSQPGVSTVIILEGINDLGAALFPEVYGEGPGHPMPRAEALIAGHRDLIVRTRARGLKAIGSTVLPWNALAANKPEAETARQTLNQWIRGRAAYDTVIDFDALMADPEDPTRLLAEYDSGDGLHPSDAGYTAMAAAVLETLTLP